MTNESTLIQRFFIRSPQQLEVVRTIGDDAAIVNVPAQQQLVITMDTLNGGIHFPETTPPFDIGYKAVMVNLSDLAAMGASPKWITLSLSMPRSEETWLAAFSQGLFAALDQFSVDLIGGDLNRGSLSITVQAEGWVPVGKALLRSGAQVGDHIYVSGELGTAALALHALQGKISLAETELKQILPALNRPQAQVELGLALRDLATSCIDLSDGLGKDLQHILTQSHVGAEIELAQLPLNPLLTEQLSLLDSYRLAVNGGDDYQLCFTMPANHQTELERRIGNVRITCIGKIIAGSALSFRNATDDLVELAATGFQHF